MALISPIKPPPPSPLPPGLAGFWICVVSPSTWTHKNICNCENMGDKCMHLSKGPLCVHQGVSVNMHLVTFSQLGSRQSCSQTTSISTSVRWRRGVAGHARRRKRWGCGWARCEGWRWARWRWRSWWSRRWWGRSWSSCRACRSSRDACSFRGLPLLLHAFLFLLFLFITC